MGSARGVEEERMRELRTRTKVMIGFAAALGVAMMVGLASFRASREVARQLDVVASSQLPVLQTLSDVQAGFLDTNAFLSQRALSRATEKVFAAEDCRACHEGGSIFKDRSEAALGRVEKAIAELASLPQGDAVRRLWPRTRSALDEWLAQARRLHADLGDRDRPLGPEADKAPEARDSRIWEEWRGLHQLADPIGDSVSKLEEALRLEAGESRAAAAAAQRRQMVFEAAVLGLGALAMWLVAFLIGRSVERAIMGLTREASRVAGAIADGCLDVRAEERAVGREFRPIVGGMNATVDALIAPIRISSSYLARFSQGEIPDPIVAPFRGEFDEVKRHWNVLIAMVTQRSRDTRLLLEAARDGRLEARADPSAYSGSNAQLVLGLNAILDAISGPLREAMRVLELLAQGDLTARMNGKYAGEYARMKDAVNHSAQALHGALARVAVAARELSGAAGEIASASQGVSSGVAAQASALEESSASLESMSSTTKESAANAQQANALAQAARCAATEGASAMEELGGAMARVRAASESTSAIIKDINEIAFQTNLLALNAAVEAARAGDAGRGFAVVAEEVRSLALRSKEAATKTEQLIRESVQQAERGERTSAQTMSKLRDIVGSSGKVSEIVAEMAASTKEQASAIEQVTRAVAQVDQVTQRNAASSQESSAAAEELSQQSRELAEMVAAFRLDDSRRGDRGGEAPVGVPEEVPHLPPVALGSAGVPARLRA
jgi:methyl-accepting chemotaxis protein